VRCSSAGDRKRAAPCPTEIGKVDQCKDACEPMKRNQLGTVFFCRRGVAGKMNRAEQGRPDICPVHSIRQRARDWLNDRLSSRTVTSLGEQQAA
jgi:hypothetical protein